MNTTTTTATAAPTSTSDRPSRHTRRRLARIAIPLLVAAAALLAVASPSQAATWSWQGSTSMNTYYGAASIHSGIGSANEWLDTHANIRDTRNDGFCAALQVRAVFSTGQVSNFITVGNTCNTAYYSHVYKGLNAAAGWRFDTAQYRMCQSDRYGRIAGQCSGLVRVNNWARVAS